jgi:hypothetical protein
MDERLLDGILGPVPITEDEARDGVQAVAGRNRERLEGLVITAPRRFHDITLHRLLHRLRDRLAAHHPTTGVDGRIVQERLPDRPAAVDILEEKLAGPPQTCEAPVACCVANVGPARRLVTSGTYVDGGTPRD